MIFQALLTLVYNVAAFIIGLSPSVSQTDTDNIATIHSAISNFNAAVRWANFFFPVDTLIWCTQLIISISFIAFGFRLVRWIASMLTAGLVK